MSDHVTVHVTEGALRGRKVTSATGASFFSFQGVPYAAPPVGELRFKAPQPPQSWSGVRDALSEGNVCPQIDELTQKYVGDEDCLFVNVYTPQLPTGGGGLGARQAVMVYIHGGGFTMGSGNSNFYGADFLVDKGAILVTFNYRLGTLGFLTTGDEEIPGNAGMKDQVAALKWVKQNIAQFGGDPNNVTLFGESAGGASVHYHLLSPMAKGLFHRAISQSGSVFNPWAFSGAGRSRTVRLARALGCETENSKDVLAFLREVPAMTLVQSILIGLTDKERRRGVYFPFVPTSERFESSEEKFVPSCPAEMMTSGGSSDVPYIIGVNSNEGLICIKMILSAPGAIEAIEKDFEGLLPEDLCPELDTAQSTQAAQALRRFYFADKPFCQETILQYTHLTSDSFFTHKVVEAVKGHLANRQSPIYLYQFAFEGELGMWKKLFAEPQYPGVCHADDLGYLFNLSVENVELVPGPAEEQIRSMMTHMWTNFAKTGNPSSGDVAWTAVGRDEQHYLRIDQEPRMMKNLDQRRMEFWDDLYRQAKVTAK